MKTLKFLVLTLTFAPVALTANHMADTMETASNFPSSHASSYGQNRMDEERIGHMGQHEMGTDMPSHAGDNTYDRMHAGNRAHEGEHARGAEEMMHMDGANADTTMQTIQ